MLRSCTSIFRQNDVAILRFPGKAAGHLRKIPAEGAKKSRLQKKPALCCSGGSSIIPILLMLQDGPAGTIDGIFVFHAAGAELHLIFQTAIVLIRLHPHAADLGFAEPGVGQGCSLCLLAANIPGGGGRSFGRLYPKFIIQAARTRGKV